VAADTVRIIQRRSVNGSSPAQRETLRSLGLHGIGKHVDRDDGPVVRGMIRVVEHLVEVQEEGVGGGEVKPAKDEPDG
jgi:large subunit ribosomal protein L30